MKKTALIAGASGLVGGQLLDALLEDAEYPQVIALLRRPIDKTHPRLEQRIVDFETYDYSELPEVDTVFCCLGTTLKQSGSKEAFRRVDHDYVLNLARGAQLKGARQFLLVGSMGANEHSPFFYMRTKGKIEKVLNCLGYLSCSVFRPAYLVGKRSQPRFAEDLYGACMEKLAFMMPHAFRPIHAKKVAMAMLKQSHQAPTGFHIIESGAMQTSQTSQTSQASQSL